MSSVIDKGLSGDPAIHDIPAYRRAQEEQQAVLRTRACQENADAGARAVAARAGYSPATMTAYVAEMAEGYAPGRVLDAAASAPGAVVWHALEALGASGPDEEPRGGRRRRRIETALRRPAAELAALAPADRDLVVEQAAFAQALAVLADWQRGRRALYAAGGGADDAFRYVFDDGQLLALWVCLDLAQLRAALPALRVVDQRDEAPLFAGGPTPSDGAPWDAEGPDAWPGLQGLDIPSDVSMTGASPEARSHAAWDMLLAGFPQGSPNSATLDISMADTTREITSNITTSETSTAEVLSGAGSDTAFEESMSMTELLFGVQVGHVSWDMAMSDTFSGLDVSDNLLDWSTAGPSSDVQTAGALYDVPPPDTEELERFAGCVAMESCLDDQRA